MRLIGVLLLTISSGLFCNENKMDYWKEQRKGANFFNSSEKYERFEAARELGIEIVRLAPNKWLNGRDESKLGDFLIGSNPNNRVPIKEDVEYLRFVLDEANRANIKIVLTMLSLPGNRWGQHNNGTTQRDIWKSFDAQNNAIIFWTALAEQLRDHPAIIGYNIKNEPSPERVKPSFKDWYTGDYKRWYRKIKGTPADLNLFYSKIVKSIRKVDPYTPIVLDCGFHATPWAFKILKPLPYDNIIYSFHMYEPYNYTSRRYRDKNYTYPGIIPTGETEAESILWDINQIDRFFKPVYDWQKKYKIPNNRIFLGEFGIFRLNTNAQQYISDVIDTANNNNWHWAFYSFREDTWDGMDYEMGNYKSDIAYWEAVNNNKTPDYSKYKTKPIYDVIKKAFEKVE